MLKNIKLKINTCRVITASYMKLKLEKIGTSIVVIKMNVKVELKSTT